MRRLAAFASTLLSVPLLAGCGSSTHTVPAGQPEVSFVQSAALAANGPVPTARSALLNCGSPVYGWLSELTHVPFFQAKVNRHWGAFIPSGPAGPGGKPVMAKQIMASGTIVSPSGGAQDVPFDHPYGGDESFDEKLAPAYANLDQGFPAPGQGTTTPGFIHDEIGVGLLPHAPGSDAITPGESWPDAATTDMNNIATGFAPSAGDQAAVMGSWVTDCGHEDFHPELHTVNFMAYGHRIGNTTVAHAFYNPYEVAQLYNPGVSLSGKVNDNSRLNASDTKDILGYVVTAIMRLASGADSAPTVPELLVPFRSSPAPWTECAPPGTSGSSLRVSYDFTVRPGVTVSESSDDTTGCATFSVKLTGQYTPADAPGQMECPTTWDWLNTNAFGQGGVGHVNIPQMIDQEVQQFSPSLAAQLGTKANQPLVSNCYPPLYAAVWPMSLTGNPMHTVTTSSAQALPLAGWAVVSWGG